MNSIYYKLIIITSISLLTLGKTFSQTDTTKRVYFPFQVGNLWQYKSGENSYSIQEITKDTLVNGKKYYKVQTSTEFTWERYDTLTQRIYALDLVDRDGDGANDDELLFDDFLAVPNRSFESYRFIYNGGSGPWYNGEPANGIEEELLVFGENVKTKVITYSMGTDAYSENFGVVYTFMDGPISSLVAARINGVDYGEFVSVKENDNTPLIYSISNYPNPFNPNTSIILSIPKEEFVTIQIYNSIGEKVKTLCNNTLPAGKHKLKFNGSNLGSGTYLVILRTESYTKTHKILLMK